MKSLETKDPGILVGVEEAFQDATVTELAQIKELHFGTKQVGRKCRNVRASYEQAESQLKALKIAIGTDKVAQSRPIDISS